MSLLNRTQYLSAITEAARAKKPRVAIVTFGAPHTWPMNSPVRNVLSALSVNRADATIYVGLPAPDTEVYEDHIRRTESFARIWQLIQWRFLPFSHAKYFLHWSYDTLKYGATGSINLADSRLNDLAVEATGGTLKALARFHTVTHRMSRAVDSEPAPLPPADWADRILQELDD